MSLLSPFQFLSFPHRDLFPVSPPPQNGWVSFGIERVPAGERTWQDGPIAVYQTRPTVSSNGRFVVVGEGDLIDKNHGQYKPDFIAEFFASCGDIPGAIAQLNGIFGLVIWDRENRELWLARDAVGGKTLYYTAVGGTLRVAPRLRTLAAFHSRELDSVALRDYLSCAFVPGEQTLWRGVRELRPGTLHRWSEGSISPQIKVYWQPEEKIGDRDRPLEFHGEKLRSLLGAIVEESLPQGEPVGAYLSGGLDSRRITF
ncbi:asparagine synthase-related protein [Lyngbya sp. CCY1209]|uniref:asparagine synthase-related protein n=1 Tax=Lyngbya sp. CCY1209 TaxID=2886103 RepID=UPI002D2117C5|nr:asparagine synthase-related protein [Lyngbya sp. CCY1209]MEB3887437.1 hypothetical protein [Lyngbya sp. CCY1209]